MNIASFPLNITEIIDNGNLIAYGFQLLYYKNNQEQIEKFLYMIKQLKKLEKPLKDNLNNKQSK